MILFHFACHVTCETYEENTNWKVNSLLDRGKRRDKVIGNILREIKKGQIVYILLVATENLI